MLFMNRRYARRAQNVNCGGDPVALPIQRRNRPIAETRDNRPIKADKMRSKWNASGMLQYHADAKHIVPDAISMNAENFFITPP
jgi:hypothetical protein